MRVARGLLLSALLGSGAAAFAQDAPAQQPAAPPPVFGAAVDLVRIDAVVLDREGRPLPGLTAADFEVEEGGKRQTISSFEPVVVRGPRLRAPDEPPRLSAARVRAPDEGRCVLVFVDDIHLTPVSAERVRASLRRFLANDVREGDWVTVFAPEQQLWWTARNAWEHRQLAAAIDGVKGHGSGDSHRDWVVVKTLEYGRMGIGGEFSTGEGSATSGGPGQFAVVGDPNAPVKQEEVVARVQYRTGISLGGLRQALESLLRLRGHKSLVVVSEGFLLLPRMPGYQESLDMARRANVAVHFVDPRGVQADQSGSDLAATLSDTEGIAEVTGGTVFSGNEPEAGLRRVVEQSDAYYLLGYEPTQAGRGERKVEVRVRGEGLRVRARTRYYLASPQETVRAEKEAGKKKPKKEDSRPSFETNPALAAMRSLSDTTDLPLRVATLYYEPNRKGEVAVMLAAEVVPPAGRPGERLYRLVSEARARAGGAPVRDQFEGTPNVTPGQPVILARQWYLPPGVWQLRLLVEDTETKRLGSLVHTFEVPEANRFRMSTPILTAEIEDPNGKRKPKVALGRTFRSGSTLYCQYSVYGAPAAGKHDWVPHVAGSWQLRSGDALVREGPPTLIQPAPDGRVTRTLGVSLRGLSPGEYSLVLAARDEKTGETLTRAEPFTVAP